MLGVGDWGECRGMECCGMMEREELGAVFVYVRGFYSSEGRICVLGLYWRCEACCSDGDVYEFSADLMT